LPDRKLGNSDSQLTVNQAIALTTKVNERNGDGLQVTGEASERLEAAHKAEERQPEGLKKPM